MTIKQIEVKIAAKERKISSDKKTLFKDLMKTLQDHVDQGELFEALKTECEDRGVGFKKHIEESIYSYQQVSKYRRIAKHKEQAKLTLFENNDNVSINQLQQILPKLNDPVEITTADTNKIPELAIPSDTSRNKNDWHTPTKYIDAARAVMGSIDLDPFTSIQANRRVKATTIYTEADDGLLTDWATVNSVWMNPPYSNGLAGKTIDKFLQERSKFKHAIVLMNAATDTQWFEKLRLDASSVCLTRGRISFEDAGGKKVSGNTKGQAFFYFGENVDEFCKIFKEIGWVVPGGECHG